jgi:hypothetical protein
MRQHTPGPWAVDTDRTILCRNVVGIADIRSWMGAEEADANARLIAAAPELLEALKDEISEVAALAGPCQAGLMKRCRCADCRLTRSRAAIAKAEGRS